MSRAIAANRILNKIRIFSRSGSAWSTDQLILSRCNQRLLKMETSGSQQRQKSSAEPRRFARPDEVNYALRQDMGEGYTRRTVEISALGTKYNMVYGEWVPVDRPVERCPAVICIHGTPATEGAYRPIGSQIASGGRGYRVLAVNFPGMGYTQNDPERRYNYSTSDKVELVKAFITALQLESVAMVIGHSIGSHVVGGLAADPELEGIVQSACFLCGTGVTPHRLFKRIDRPILIHLIFKLMYLPFIGWMVIYVCAQIMHRMGFRGRTREAQALAFYEIANMKFDMLMYLPFVGWMVIYVCAQMMHRIGFRGRTREAQALTFYEVANINFDMFHQNLLRISERRLPVLLFYSFNDTVVESELLQENIDVLQIPEADIKDYDADGLSEHVYQDGTLRRVVRFASGTHRLQFTNPEKTSAEIVSLLDALGKR